MDKGVALAEDKDAFAIGMVSKSKPSMFATKLLCHRRSNAFRYGLPISPHFILLKAKAIESKARTVGCVTLVASSLLAHDSLVSNLLK